MAAVAQLFARLSQEIEESRPKNCIHFIVDFLCKHYPEHLHGFASIWQMDGDLERERHEVVNFFKAHKVSTAVAAHFTNAGYDTLDTLTTLSPDALVDVEAFNNVKWLPGHKVRLQQIFGEISARVRAYRQQQREALVAQQHPKGTPGVRHHGGHHPHPHPHPHRQALHDSPRSPSPSPVGRIHAAYPGGYAAHRPVVQGLPQAAPLGLRAGLRPIAPLQAPLAGAGAYGALGQPLQIPAGIPSPGLGLLPPGQPNIFLQGAGQYVAG